MSTPLPVPADSPSGRVCSRLTVASTDWVTYDIPANVQRLFIVPIAAEAYWSYTASGTFNAADVDYNTIPSGVSFEFPIRNGISADVRQINLSHSSGTGVFEFEMDVVP